MNQPTLNLEPRNPKPETVECLRQRFPSEEARREHFLKLLAQKLKDPEFRKIEGFPIGKDEDILALSDPPYYTACPNPWLGEFIKHYGAPYNLKRPYHREPFAADVSEGKNHPIYKAHSYHTKVPHRAIMRYLLHYTQPGDVVFDGFCGTGMTGVAAQLCGNRVEVQALGYRVQDDGTILNEDGKPFSKLGARHAILNDLAPAAAFIAYNYNTPTDVDAFESEAKRILKEVENDLGWMYETTHTDGRTKGRINYTVWSDVFTCHNCQGDVVFMDVALDDEGEVSAEGFKCTHCDALLSKATAAKRMEKAFTHLGPMVERIKKVPVLLDYSIPSSRLEKKFDKCDQRTLDKINSTNLPASCPSATLDKSSEQYKRDALHLRGIETASDFYTRRNLIVLGSLWEKVLELTRQRQLGLFWMTSIQWLGSNMYRYREGGGGGQQGKLTIPSLIREQNVFRLAADKLNDILKVARLISLLSGRRAIATGDAAEPGPLPNCSVDYVFIDPPFGGNIFYSDLNCIWEGWLRVVTARQTEAVVHRVQTKAPKNLHDYSVFMFSGFKAAFAALKPGRWMTVEFSNSQAAVWNSIQTSLQEAGFVVANVAALDKKQRSFRSVTSATAVKQDLVISAYKANDGLEERFAKRGETEEGAWDFARSHLKNLPVVKAKGGQLELIAERDPRILYDRMVAFYVGHSTLVPLNSAEFQAGLAEKFPERDGMYFLPEQVNEYDKKRAQMGNIGQLTIFVEDERSAINWLRNLLKDCPSTYQDIQPEFLQQLGASWKKWEARPELSALLDQNFLCYDGQLNIPAQIVSWMKRSEPLRKVMSQEGQELPTGELETRNQELLRRAKARWYVPDPKKNVDVETLRNKRLLEEFWTYLPPGYEKPQITPMNADKGQSHLRQSAKSAVKTPKGKKLKELRTEAVRVGFKHCYQQKDYTTILAVAQMLPESVLNEDEQLQMIYDTAVTRSGGGE